jgi:hypothetical protein
MVGLIALVLALAVMARASGGANQVTPRPTSFLSSPGGGRALYLTLAEVGLPTVQRRTRVALGDTMSGAFLVLAPTRPYDAREARHLMRWVRAGGGLMYVPPRGAGGMVDDALADSLGLKPVRLRPDADSLLAAGGWRGATGVPVSHPWTVNLKAVPGWEWAMRRVGPAKRGRVLLQTKDSVALAVTFPVGDGRVVAFSDPAPVTNGALRDNGLAPLVVQSAARLAAGGPVVFDEFHHGYREDGSIRGAVGRWLRETDAGHGVLQLAAVGLGLLLLLGWRFGAPTAPPPAERRSPLEHVEALAGAYRQAGARATARRLVVAGMARRLGRRTVPTGDAAADDLVERLTARLPVAQEAAARVSEEWRKGERADLVALTRNVDTLLTEVKRT